MTTASGKAGGEAPQREWQPRIWEGCDFFAWARLLVRNRFAVGWRHLYIAAVVSVVSIFHTLLRWLQRAWYGSRRENWRLPYRSSPPFSGPP